MRVRQVENVLDLFELFGRDPSPRTLTDLSRELAMPKSSTFNLIETLVERGFLYETRHRGGYFPTRRLHDVALAITDGDLLLGQLHDELERLASATGESVLLSVREGDHVIYVDVVESPSPVRYHAAIGDRRPLFVTSSGKAILMSYSREEQDALLAAAPRLVLHDGTVRTVEELRADLNTARRRGWSEDRSESTHDVMGVGIPLVHGNRRFGIAVAGPLYRVRSRKSEIATLLKTAVARLSQTGAEAGSDEPGRRREP